MTKHTERLMSRVSVAAMAAHAPKPEAAATIPAFAERVEESAGDAGGQVDPIDGLTAEEQAGLDAMRSDGVAAGEAEPAVAGAGDGDGDDADGDDDAVAAASDGDGTPAPAEGEARPKPKTISYGRHQKELAKAEKARADLQTQLDGSRQETARERDERTRLDERSRLLLDAISTKKPPDAPALAADADPEPDEADDPIGHSQWKIRKLEKTVADMQGGQRQQQQATAAENEERQVYDTLVSDIQRVVAGDPARGVAADPSMTDAFVHLRETRYQELGFIFAHIDINDPAQCATLSAADQKKLSDNIQQTFHNEQMLVARQSITAGKSPAAVIRNLARARGWKPAEAGAVPVPAAGGAAPRVNGGAAPAPAARAAGTVKEQLGVVRENLEASRSLSDAGGSPGGQMTPERLGSMSDAEFNEYYNSISKDKLDQMMGKPANM